MTIARALIGYCILSVALSLPLFAQTMSVVEEHAIQAALNRGQLLYAYDQAAWHGTDAMLAATKGSGSAATLPSTLGGWIVHGTANDPSVIFFDKDVKNPHAVFVVQLTDGGRRVSSSQFMKTSNDVTIDDEARSLIRARQVATVAFLKANMARCAKGQFNITVLPPELPGGSSLVYVLSPQDSLDKVPFGGNYRIEVSAGGDAGPVHAFTRTCLELATSHSKDSPKALVVTQLLDPLPTENSVFTMFAANLPMYVGTPDKRIWAVEAVGGKAQIRIVSNDRPPSGSRPTPP